MTKLTFPTQAEQALADWRAQTKTIALTTICVRHGGQRTGNKPRIEYTFDDDSSISIEGQGQAHKVQTHLP